MRKSRQEAEATRRRIVRVASREIRRTGAAAASLDDLLAAADLTRGAFYRHFASKEQLVAEALSDAVSTSLDAWAAEIENAPAGSPVAAAANAYLSTEHRENRAGGCPFAALGSELARTNVAVQRAATSGLNDFVALLAKQYAQRDPEHARRNALAAASTLVGGLTLARIVDDPGFSAEILAASREQVVRSEHRD